MKRFEWNRRRHPARHARPGWVTGALIDKNAPITDATTPQTMKGVRMTSSPTTAVIVTGALCRIGRAAALRLARDGFAVVANYAGNAARAEGAVNEIMGQVLRTNVGYA